MNTELELLKKEIAALRKEIAELKAQAPQNHFHYHYGTPVQIFPTVPQQPFPQLVPYCEIQTVGALEIR